LVQGFGHSDSAARSPSFATSTSHEISHGRALEERERPTEAVLRVRASGQLTGSVERSGVDERSRRIAKRFEVPMLIAALLVIPVIVVEQSDVGEPWRTIAGVLNWAIWIAFAVEFVVMLAVVPDRWRWLRSHPLEVVIVLLTPPFLPSSLQALRALRVLRLLRLLRLAQLARRTFSLDGLRYAAILAVLTSLGGGYAYSAAESAQEPAPSVWDGVWWAVTTMTTVATGTSTRRPPSAGSTRSCS